MRTVFLNLKGNIGDYASYPIFATRCGKPEYIEANNEIHSIIKKYQPLPATAKNCKAFWYELTEVFYNMLSPANSNQKRLFDEMETYIDSVGEKIAYCNIRLKRSLVENIDVYIDALVSNPCTETYLTLMTYNCSMENEPEALETIASDSDEILVDCAFKFCKNLGLF